MAHNALMWQLHTWTPLELDHPDDGVDFHISLWQDATGRKLLLFRPVMGGDALHTVELAATVQHDDILALMDKLLIELPSR